MYVENLIQYLYDMIASGEIEKSGKVEIIAQDDEGIARRVDVSTGRLEGDGGKLIIWADVS